MELLMLRSMWSAPPETRAMIGQTVAAGFDGIEGPIPPESTDRALFREALEVHGLSFVAEATTGLRGDSPHDWWVPDAQASVDDHLDDLRWTLEHAAEMGAMFVSSMCGYDAWSLDQNVAFFGRAMEVARSAGVDVSFETHRCRSLYSPWVTRDILRQLPEMRVTCDFSHWCVVAERLIDTEQSIIEMVADRAHHVQCRVGYAQHAQVPDPRDPAYAKAVASHERWWDLVWDAQARRGMQTVTMTSEWGAEGYMQTLPYTGQPVADLWEVTCGFAQRQRQRFAERGA